eukprot:m.32010 g.32010  ORF g.32010 m.32010 type:complete len:458 (-) comp6352_c0_seq2:57-1430(-)
MRMGTSLVNFFVFNDTFGLREDNEEEKIMYFYPENAPLGMKMKKVGLSSAYINFARPFSPDKPVEIVHTKHMRQAFFQPEPHFWMCMTIKLKTVVKGKLVEFQEEEVLDESLLSLLKQSYAMLKLFEGKLQTILDERGREGLMSLLNIFYKQYLKSIDVENANVVDALNGIQFLPLDKLSYLCIQSFVNSSETSLRGVQETMFLYDHFLVWSGLEQADTLILYRYLTCGLLKERTKGKEEGNDGLICLLGAEDMSDDDSPIDAPTVHHTVGGEIVKSRLVVYKFRSILCCFLVDSNEAMDIDLHREMNTFLEPRLQELNESIGTDTTDILDESPYKFLYFNFMNLAQKSSFMDLTKGALLESKSSSISEQEKVARTIMGILHSDLAKEKYECEIVVKTQDENWVVARSADEREVFVLFTNKLSNLTEVEAEMANLSQTEFGNIFFTSNDGTLSAPAI